MKSKIIIILFCVFSIFCRNANAQNILFPTDSISIENFLETIRKNSSYNIYAIIDQPQKVIIKKQDDSILKLIEGVLEQTPYKISIYENNIFILRENNLNTNYPTYLTKDNLKNNENTSLVYVPKREKATSENKVYAIGDPYIKETHSSIILTGKVLDFKTSEPLTGVNLSITNPWTATATDRNGEFSIKLPAGRVQLEISGLNIKNTRRQLMLYGDGSLDIELEEETHELGEVTVTTGRIDNIRSTQLGMEKLQISQIKNIPMALGEVDILKVIQALPGVKTVGEASSGFNVRGGATDQNLILLNDGTIYNANHLFGFFTAFSSDMVKEAEMYKSSIPAQYGGRISSVLDIKGKEANKEKFTGSAGIGLVTSKLNLEIPLLKDRTSILLSGRTTYSDWILKNLPEKSGYKDGTAGFYDLGAVFSHKANEKNMINIYGYYSNDRFSFSKEEKYGYTNANASIKWRTVLNDKLVGYFAAGYDHYDYYNRESKLEESAFRLSFSINQAFIKSDFSYDLTANNKIDFGFKSTFYDINSGTFEPYGENSLIKHDKLQKDKALESALYIGDQWNITPDFSVNAGIRYSIFNALGPRNYNIYAPGMLPYPSTAIDTVSAGSGKVIKTYHGPEFRLSARYVFTENLSVKAGFNSMRQYIHKLSNTAIMSPTDTWKLSDVNIRPQQGWQAATGLYLNSPGGTWEYSTEVYYKKMKDYLDYRSGAKILMNHHIETDVISTQGHSYGVEVSARKTVGKLNGWASYTYSRTFLRQSDKLIENPVNGGDWYPTEYDKPHDFKFVGNYKFTQRYSVSVNLDYSTGRPVTIPAGKYYDHQTDAMRVYYSDRNSYRVPDYFRTDISFNIEPSHKLTLLTHSSISIGVYNVTGRKNVYSVYYLVEEGKVKGYQLSIFGTPIPFVTYNIRF